MKLFRQISMWFCFTLLAFVLVGCTSDILGGDKNINSSTGDKPKPPVETIQMTLFYPDIDALHLFPVTIEVVKDEKWLENGIKQLAEQPQDKKLSQALPDKELIRGIRIENETAYVDMNEAVLKNTPRGATIEQIIIQSIVHTIVKNTNAKKIVFTIDGKDRETLLGHIDIIDPIEPDMNWLEK